MKNDRFLSIPLDFDRLSHGAKLRDVDFNASIAQWIYLILITECGELSSDKDFGTTVWDYDFTIANFTTEWRDNVTNSITQSI